MLTKVTNLERLAISDCAFDSITAAAAVHDFSGMVNTSLVARAAARGTYFDRVFRKFGAPTWPNGFDIAPEWLRREMFAAGELSPVAAE